GTQVRGLGDHGAACLRGDLQPARLRGRLGLRGRGALAPRRLTAAARFRDPPSLIGSTCNHQLLLMQTLDRRAALCDYSGRMCNGRFENQRARARLRRGLRLAPGSPLPAAALAVAVAMASSFRPCRYLRKLRPSCGWPSAYSTVACR